MKKSFFLFSAWQTTLQVESESESCSVKSDSLPPQELYSPWNSPGQNTGLQVVIQAQLQADSLPTEGQGKPKNTGVGSLAYPFSKGTLQVSIS